MAAVARNSTVSMYSRRTCHLCDEARAVILAELAERRRAGRPFDFDEICIDGDDALEREYGLRVPVVEIDGVEAFEYHVDAARLRSLLSL